MKPKFISFLKQNCFFRRYKKMKLVLTPDLFLGKDVVIEGFSFLVLIAFFILCYNYYKLNKKKNLLYLGIGFLLIAIAQLANIMTKLVLYYDTTFTREVGMMIVTYKVVNSVDIFYQMGFFFHRILTLIGFYVIYKLVLKKKWTGDSYLVAYLIVLISWASLYDNNAYYFLFHLTTIPILLLIIKNYILIYTKGHNQNTGVLVISFSLLAIGQFIFILSKFSENLFVLANVIELSSYLMLLILIIRIIK